MKKITDKKIVDFKKYLQNEEKSSATIDKYIRDVKKLEDWCPDCELTKNLLLKYKKHLIESYAPASVNCAIASINSFFSYMGWYELRIKALKIQKQIFSNKDKELTKEEYQRLIKSAKTTNMRMYYIMQTMCSTGIRVSELKFITVEAVQSGQAVINCKGKVRVAIIPKQMCIMLRRYIKQNKIKNGAVFVSKSGNPLDRSNIWADMKKLCETASVSREKVFPHNLRHLFARTFYSVQKDIVRLADILGHSSVNTTRIYTMETCETHRKQIQELGLVFS